MISVIPSVLGKTRKAYLNSFINDNEIIRKGFSNAISEESSVSFEATSHAIDILDYYGKSPNDIEELQENLEQHIITMFDVDNIDLYDLYYLTKSLIISDYAIKSNILNKTLNFLMGTEQLTGGFSISNISSSISMTSTYYVIQLLLLIDQPIANKSIHKNWILSCINADGGFGGNSSLPSTLTNTYHAILTLNDMDELNSLIDHNKTVNYLKSHYVISSADSNNFGGYLPDKVSTLASLFSTYYCIKAISLINATELNEDQTITWVLNRQNVQDGGFVDNTEAYQQKFSSVISSYYAFETLRILNPTLSKLSSEIWMVEFNYWILGIVIIALGLIIAIPLVIWKKRRI